MSVKKRPKSSFNTTHKKSSKSKKENDIYSTFHMKGNQPRLLKNGTEESLSNQQIYQYTPEEYFNLCGYPYKNLE